MGLIELLLGISPLVFLFHLDTTHIIFVSLLFGKMGQQNIIILDLIVQQKVYLSYLAEGIITAST